jgi:DNA-binding MarR family transcriptional regulator
MPPDHSADPRRAAWRALVEAHGAVFGRLVDELRDELAMPVTWYDVLLHLSEGEGERRRMTELARAVVVSKSGLTGIVDRLEEAGLVRREVPRHDRRAIDVVMTDAGRERFLEARHLHGRGIDRLFCAHITPEEGRVLLAALARVRVAAEAS